MKSDILTFFDLHRQIFGICPNPECSEFFRLSDCRVFLKKEPELDWMDKIDKEQSRLDKFEEKLGDIEQDLREKAREKGRRLAQAAVREIDPIFTPRKLNPDDAKVIFHPIDYVVFNGLKAAPLKNIVLLDRQAEGAVHRRLQESIERVIDRENYEWQTLRVQDNGKIKSE